MASRIPYEQLDPAIKDLLGKAYDVSKNAFQVYSKFQIGSAVLTKSGNVYVGTFVETASGPEGICAERAALSQANAMNDREIVKIAVVGDGDANNENIIITPCGGCRQFIYEFSRYSNSDIDIYCANSKLQSVLHTTISELLPFPFYY